MEALCKTSTKGEEKQETKEEKINIDGLGQEGNKRFRLTLARD